MGNDLTRLECLEVIALSRDLAQWRYEEVKGEAAKGLPDGKTWDAVLDLHTYFAVSCLGIKGLGFLDSNGVYALKWNGETVNIDQMESDVLSVLFSAVESERQRQADEKRLVAYRDGIIRVFQQAYGYARPTDEVITGQYAKDFAGVQTWSKALDFDVPDTPEFKGIRYIDFTDCTDIHALFKNGESMSLYDMSKSGLDSIKNGFDIYLKALNNRKGAVKNYKRFADLTHKGKKNGNKVK